MRASQGWWRPLPTGGSEGVGEGRGEGSWAAAGSRGVLLCLSLWLATGCSMVGLHQDLEEAEGLGLVTGRVTVPKGELENVLVALYRWTETEPELENIDRLSSRLREFVFILEAAAPHLLVAFQDQDGDRVLDAGEPAATARVVVQSLQRLEDQDLRLGAGAQLPAGVEIDFSELEMVDYESVPIAAGEVTTLDDRRFGRKEAAQGMWSPLTSIRDVGAGIYFLEPYDRERIPVIFVHGIGGSPVDLRSLIERLDRGRFQPWVYQYPSGVRLQRAGDGLARILDSLRGDLDCDRVFVVAHSMGGLVARSAVLEADASGPCPIELLVTFSTPWGGHSAASLGVKWAPVVVPAWIDMQPGSEFLDTLHRELPNDIPHHLLFGFKTGRNPLMLYSHDTVVSVASQLPIWAQRQARRIYGFDLDHAGILTDEEAVSTYLRILDEVAVRD